MWNWLNCFFYNVTVKKGHFILSWFWGKYDLVFHPSIPPSKHLCVDFIYFNFILILYSIYWTFSDLGVNVNVFMRYVSISSKADLEYTASCFTSVKSALHPSSWAEVKLSSWNLTVNVFPHQLQPLPGILSTEWTQHSWVIVHRTKTSTHCGMCSQMRPCIVQEINRIGQVFILLFCSSWNKSATKAYFLVSLEYLDTIKSEGLCIKKNV